MSVPACHLARTSLPSAYRLSWAGHVFQTRFLYDWSLLAGNSSHEAHVSIYDYCWWQQLASSPHPAAVKLCSVGYPVFARYKVCCSRCWSVASSSPCPNAYYIIVASHMRFSESRQRALHLGVFVVRKGSTNNIGLFQPACDLMVLKHSFHAKDSFFFQQKRYCTGHFSD